MVDYPATLNWQWRNHEDVPISLSAGRTPSPWPSPTRPSGTAIGQVTLDKIDLTAASSAATVYESTQGRTTGTVAYNYGRLGRQRPGPGRAQLGRDLDR